MRRMSPTRLDWEMLWQWLVLGSLPMAFMALSVVVSLKMSPAWALIGGPLGIVALWALMVGGNYACGYKGKHWGDG